MYARSGFGGNSNSIHSILHFPFFYADAFLRNLLYLALHPAAIIMSKNEKIYIEEIQ
ncbi:hypothetical protein M5X11_32070 [Paenibacillus alginolyticus]|uniref:Uncharacterized protein n=1 Tax=Paenibacillus alginolyticus TaxID=59839 RepID=A0ABT4GFC5_9BACL|nr:hypothetical protein [Paenibacillus alginolyticus]MCY9669511.1 hypothetical protein [Paenibacillus alginolyticus]MCY9694885.1 hypothetical protein [Paenibacillus alginolyticus]MEC0147279.1 hypothetical protein [Paenibacillus alginolyticus]